MEQNHYVEAEGVYRADLGLNNNVQRCAQHKNNVWSLHGLVECLKHRGETKERTDFQALLTSALANTDVAVTSSCCCRKTVVDTGNC